MNYSDVFLSKYDTNGNELSTKIFDNSSDGAQVGTNGIAIDSANNVDLTGTFIGTVGFDGVGGHDIQTNQTPSNDSDTFVTQYKANGSYGWTRTFDTSSSNAGALSLYIATDSSNDIFISGLTSGTVTFGQQNNTDTFTALGPYAAFLSEFDSSGNYVTTTELGGAYQASSSADGGLTITPQGTLYMAGNFQYTVIFDGIGGSYAIESSEDDGYNAFLSSYELSSLSSNTTTTGNQQTTTTNSATTSSSKSNSKKVDYYSTLGIATATSSPSTADTNSNVPQATIATPTTKHLIISGSATSKSSYVKWWVGSGIVIGVLLGASFLRMRLRLK